MNIYYLKNGTIVGRAWSYMECDDKTDHKPHSHYPEYTMYGPYMCSGYPVVEIYTSPPRRPVNPQKAKEGNDLVRPM